MQDNKQVNDIWGARFLRTLQAAARSQFAHHGRCFSFYEIDGGRDGLFITQQAIAALRANHPDTAGVFDTLEQAVQAYDPQTEIVLLRAQATEYGLHYWVSRLSLTDPDNIITFATIFRSLAQ